MKKECTTTLPRKKGAHMTKNSYKGIIQKEAKRRKIKVLRWHKPGSVPTYEAYFESRSIRVPDPIDDHHFLICLHEIGHLVTGERNYSYLMEYNAEQWAINRAKERYNIVDELYIVDAKEYVIRCMIADIVVRGLKINQIKQKVLDWIGISKKEVQEVVLANAASIVLDWARKKNILQEEELADLIITDMPLGDTITKELYKVEEATIELQGS